MEVRTSLENATESLCANAGMKLQNAVYRPHISKEILKLELRNNYENESSKYLFVKQRTAWDIIAVSYTMYLHFFLMGKKDEELFEKVDDANHDQLLSYIAMFVESGYFKECLKISCPEENHAYPNTGFNLRRLADGKYWFHERGCGGHEVTLEEGISQMKEQLQSLRRLYGPPIAL